MKNQIRSAQIVVPCAKFDESLAFFTETLGFRVEMIFPADAPIVAVISGYDTTLRLEKSVETQFLTLRLTGDFGESAGEISSPDGVRVILADVSRAVEIPEMRQKLIVSALDSEDVWGAGRAGMQYRDLIPGRLGGRFVASHIRIPVGGEVPDYVHFHKVRFQMIYCISGWAKLVYENQGEPFMMNAGDCVLQPPEIRHRVLESSDQFEVLEIGCPAIHETYADHQMPLPNETLAPEKNYANQRFLHHVAERSVWKQSPFEKIESRDTGIFNATNGLADVQVLRAIADTNFSIKHSDEFLFFFILKGELKLESADQTYQLKTGGSFVLPNDAEFQISAGKGLEMIQIKLFG